MQKALVYFVIAAILALAVLVYRTGDIPSGPPPDHFLIRGRLHNEQTSFTQKVGQYCFTFTWHDSQSTMVSRVPCTGNV